MRIPPETRPILMAKILFRANRAAAQAGSAGNRVAAAGRVR